MQTIRPSKHIYIPPLAILGMLLLMCNVLFLPRASETSAVPVFVIDMAIIFCAGLLVLFLSSQSIVLSLDRLIVNRMFATQSIPYAAISSIGITYRGDMQDASGTPAACLLIQGANVHLQINTRPFQKQDIIHMISSLHEHIPYVQVNDTAQQIAAM